MQVITDGRVVTADIEVYCHDLEVTSLCPGGVKFGVRGSSLLSCT